ncbi:MAG: hypothetical protein AB7N80_15695 [Bdellovibrionales bacterium]
MQDFRLFKKNHLILVLLALVTVILFQNCSSGYDSTSTGEDSASQGGGTAPPPVNPPPVNPPPGPAPSLSGLFVTLPATGTTDVILHPSAQAVGVSNQTVIFGLPFPRGAVSDANLIRVLDGAGQEIPAQVSALNFWRDFQNPAQIISIRSVRIVLQRTFANTNPVTIRIQYGVSRNLNLAGNFVPTDYWQSIAVGPNPTEYPAAANVREPIVYATLSPQWMSQSLLQTRTTTANSIAAYGVFDTAFLAHSNTVVTGAAYQTGSEPWLYDRAQTLYIAYFRTGDLVRLRHAHRAAQFYKANIGNNGAFALGGDAKYVYGQSMLYDYMLLADESLLAVIERATLPHAGWPTNFSANTNFWTERNSAYALQAVLAAFDAVGTAAYATRARALFNSYFSMQQTPINNWLKNGCPLHTAAQHDPSEDLPAVVCSPWMGALLSEAVWKYYLLSGDNNALIYLADYADYIQAYALYSEGNVRLPYYGASSFGTTDPDGDREHACDVFGALARGFWAKRALARNAANLQADVTALLSSCQNNVSSSGLSPLRKYSWWFGTNSDFAWFLTQ